MNEYARSPEYAATNQKLSAGVSFLLNLALESETKLFDRAENTILLDSMKPEPDAAFSVGVTINDVNKFGTFSKTRQACILIDAYARNSIHTIAIP